MYCRELISLIEFAPAASSRRQSSALVARMSATRRSRWSGLIGVSDMTRNRYLEALPVNRSAR